MKIDEKRQLLYGIICWALFAVILLAFLDGRSWVTAMDHFGYQLTQPTMPNKTSILRIITQFGDPFNLQVATLVLMVFLWWRKRIADSLWFGALDFVGYALVIIVKYTVMRPRPSDRLVRISGYSFPSGHTFATTIFILTLVTFICPLIKRKWVRALTTVIGALLILLIMYTRVYLRAHYASDVVAGLLLAAGWWLITNAERHRCAEWLLAPLKDFFD